MKLVFGPSVLMMKEGQETPGMLMISLDREWSADITVTIVSSNPNVAMVIQDTVTFPAMTVGQKMIQVLAPVDDDTINDTTTIVASAVETGTQIVTVNVDDPDMQTLYASPARVAMTEGRTESLSVRLAKKPASAVVVTLASSNTAKLTLDTTTLTFNAGNYSLPQSITLTAVKDDDALNEHVSVRLTATGNIENLTVPVDITDIDAVNLDVTPPSVALVERSNMPKTVSVSLTKAPPNDMNVTVVSSKPTKVTATPATLSFTAANYMTPQLVTIDAVPDNDANDETATVTFTATGLTPAPDPRDVSVTVHDPDSQSIMAVPGALSLVEGTTTTFTVQLALQPDGDTTVNVFSQNPGEIQLLPPVLHFNAANYNMPQTVTVQSEQDDDLADDDVNLTLIASTAANVTVGVHITDDDHQAIQLVPAGGGSSLTIQEGASSALGVRLAFRPGNTTEVDFAAATATGPTKLSVAPTAVAFTGADYSIPKFVSLTALHLPDMVDVQATVTASGAGASDVALPVHILDIDTQNLLVDTDAVSVAEAFGPPAVLSAPATFKVKLALQPPTPVTPLLTLSPNLVGKVTVAMCTTLSGAPAMMTGCTVAVTPIADNDTRTESGTITISAPGLTPRTVAVTVTDNDKQSLVVTAPTSPINEPPATGPAVGTSSTFTVGLMYDPLASVTISVFSDNPSHFSVTPSTITFTAGAFSPQLVTITALDDDDMADATTSITVAGGGLTAPPIPMTATNTDVQTIVLTPATNPLTIQEGTSTQIGARLAFRPVGGVSVDLASDGGSRLGLSPASVNFDRSSFSNQFVTITAPHDFMIDPPIVPAGTFTITANSTSTTPAPTSATKLVNITDIDTLNFTLTPISPGSIIVEGGATATFTVGLTATPTNPPVVVTVTSLTPASVTAKFPGGIDTCSLSTVTSTCVVTVSATSDFNALAENVMIYIEDKSPPPMTAMRPIQRQTVSVVTVDTDTQGLDITTPNPTIHENGGTTSFTVKLHTQPAGDTIVNVTAMPDAAGGIALSSTGMAPAPGAGVPLALTFTPANYNVSQTVTITGVPDTDLRTDPFSIRVTAPGLGVTDQFVDVSEIDDNTQQIVISSVTGVATCPPVGADLMGGMSPVTSLGSLTEGDASNPLQFCVNLKYQPLSNTVVDVALTPSILSANATGLSFSTLAGVFGGYDTPQLLSLTAGSDNDAMSEQGQVSLSSSGFAAIRSVAFPVTDPDIQNFIFTDGLSNPISAVNVIKGGSSAAVQVLLAYDPISSVNVTCGSPAPVSISPTMFSLTGGSSGTWTMGQQITVIAAVDANPATEHVTISCMATGVPTPGHLTVNASP